MRVRVTWLRRSEVRSEEKRSTSAKATMASSPSRTSMAWTAATPPQQQRVATSALTSGSEAEGLGVGSLVSPEPSMADESRRGVRSTYGGGAVCGSRSSSERSSDGSGVRSCCTRCAATLSRSPQSWYAHLGEGEGEGEG